MTSILFVLLMSLSKTATAQNYEFSSYQCSPSACQLLGPATKSGGVTVTFSGTCTGGAVTSISTFASTYISNCTVAYQPFAKMQISDTEVSQCPAVWVSYVTPWDEVFTVGGVVVFSQYLTFGCDGSKTGTVKIGTKPC
jgi:hypothetical protein